MRDFLENENVTRDEADNEILHNGVTTVASINVKPEGIVNPLYNETGALTKLNNIGFIVLYKYLGLNDVEYQHATSVIPEDGQGFVNPTYTAMENENTSNG